jgi:hypothetical protein
MALSAGAQAAVAPAEASPYLGIPRSNVFRLRAPPPPVREALPPLPRITLIGITTMDGKRVLLKVQPPAKPGERLQEQSYILAEGQRAGDVEVLRIDELTGGVAVRNSGVPMLLTFANDGPKPRNLPLAPPPLPP